MSSYEQSPQDEGYSEDPLTVGTSVSAIAPWVQSMSAAERTGRLRGL
jgi:F-box and WD-40 domain protein 1/11